MCILNHLNLLFGTHIQFREWFVAKLKCRFQGKSSPALIYASVRKINVCKIEVHYARNVGLAFQEYFGLVCKAKIVSREFVSRALNY